ncbi:hypothetical protein O6H91_13G034600 [Diphasiastrum complanatum]|uniref:Uncharacterized protein n=1 Tax=Diphasiastrum complanatum TaxID=34168 RepID=A0ACC2BTR6_DIPCM|nr:hypothetical protein O6H91_13G034600 [Diphasiastrum complanatum]
MAPWRVDSADAGPAAAERALSFISKSLLDVQRSADQDIKLIKARAKSFRDLASTLDKEWDSFKFPSLTLGNGESYSGFLGKFKDSSKQETSALIISPLTAISAQVEDLNFVKKLKPKLSQFRRSYSDPDFWKRREDVSSSNRSPARMNLSVLQNALAPLAEESGMDFFLGKSQRGGGRRVVRNSSEKRMVIKDLRDSKGKKGKRKVRLPADEWEPLRRVKESLKDLETSAAASKTPSEFFQNVKKTDFFENMKKNLKRSFPPLESQEQFGNDVAPLDVPELLENLVRQSEPFLDQLGVSKEVSVKVCEMLRSCKRKGQTSLSDASCKTRLNSSKPLGKIMDELDLRVASVFQSTGYHYKGGLWGEHEMSVDSGDGRRNIAIVTTASLPWMTGTAVNPLFRAVYLAKNGKQKVTLLIPWLCKKDQEQVYPNRITFNTPNEQELYVRSWLEERVGFKPEFTIAFYPGRFSTEKRSILASGDISQFVPDKEADIAVLEEPEHLTWYYHGKRWTDKFKDVIGVVHTNYLEYVKREKNGAVQAFLLEHVNNWMVKIYCNKVIRLSAATQNLPKSIVCNVHGVSPKFIEIGRRITAETGSGKKSFSKGAYFLGKMIWGKGYRELVDLLSQHKNELEGLLDMDVFGSGEDSAEVQATAEKLGLAISFHQGRDHADDSLQSYKVFINPSVSDVVCTTTAEALAMGKIVVCANHPSNEFFRSFPNCLTYSSSEEFVEKVKQAMTSEPVPLSQEHEYLLSWEAATDRFLQNTDLDKPFLKTKPLMSDDQAERKTMTLSRSLPNLSEIVDKGLAFSHYFASGIEPARLISGALPGTMHFDEKQSKDLGLPHPSVQRPVYGW